MAAAEDATAVDADIAPTPTPTRYRRVRPPKPIQVPVPIVVIEPDASVEIAFRLAQGPDSNGESPQRTNFPPGTLPMLRTPTVEQISAMVRQEGSEDEKPAEGAG